MRWRMFLQHRNAKTVTAHIFLTSTLRFLLYANTLIHNILQILRPPIWGSQAQKALYLPLDCKEDFVQVRQYKRNNCTQGQREYELSRDNRHEFHPTEIARLVSEVQTTSACNKGCWELTLKARLTRKCL